MTLSSQPLPSIGAANSTEDPKIRSLLSELQGILNGNIDASNLAVAAGVTEAQLAAALATRLGLGTAGRGKSIIATSEVRTNTAYGTMTTPDKVTVTLPTDGLICIAYQATWTLTGTGPAQATVFLGANEVLISSAAGAPTNINIATNSAGIDRGLATSVSGMVSGAGSTSTTSDVTTGQVVGVTPTTPGSGGVLSVFAAAGTYDVTVQFKVPGGGSVTVKNRKLWVWTMGF